MNNIIISGPFLKTYAPWGKVIESCSRNEWFVSRKATSKDKKSKSEIRRRVANITGEICLGSFCQLISNPKRFIVLHTYPQVEFNTMEKAVNYLVKNEGKIVFLS
jgi:hypothetical protein